MENYETNNGKIDRKIHFHTYRSGEGPGEKIPNNEELRTVIRSVHLFS